MNTNREIITTWGRNKLASALGIPKERVRGWERLDTLPKEYWKDLLACVPDHMTITPDLLINIAARN